MGSGNRSRWLGLVAGFAPALLMMAGSAGADGAPSNQELYQMILGLQASQHQLESEAAAAKADAAQARSELEAAQSELAEAREQLAAAIPAVGSAGREEDLVRVARQERGIEPFVEFHWLRFSNSETDFGIIDDGTGALIGESSNKIIHPEWSPAIRAGARLTPGDSGLDVLIAYTHFVDKYSAELRQPFEPPYSGSTTLFATQSHPAFGETAEEARATVRYNYDSLDFEVGQNLLVGEDLDLRLFGGIRYLDFFKHTRNKYFGGDFADEVDGGARAIQDGGYWGLGPRVGAGGSWNLPWGLNVFGQAATSVLVGEGENEIILTNNGDADLIAFTHRDTGVQMVPALDIRAGIGWDQALGEWGVFSLLGGYEFQNYFGAIEHMEWSDDAAVSAIEGNTVDLSIDGFFFRGALRFR